MAVTIAKPVNVGHNAWLYRWSSTLGDPVYRVYRNGRHVRTTITNQDHVTLGDSETVVVEVRDDASAPSLAFSPQGELTWSASTNVDYYRIEEFVASEWVVRARVKDTGAPRYSWLTRALDDVTTHQFRLTPIGKDGNAGATSTVTALMIRHPDVPKVTRIYSDATKKVTFAAVA